MIMISMFMCFIFFFFFKQKTAYEMRISDWSSDVCSSDLEGTWRPQAVPDLRRYGYRMSGRDYHVDIAGNFEVAFDGEADLMRHMAMRTAVPDASIDQCPAGPEHDRTRPGGGADRKSTRLNSSH